MITGGVHPNQHSELDALRTSFEDFLHAAVHDIRGPLGQVRALAVLLERQHQESLNPEGRELCSLIDAASKRAIDVVDSIHAYTQVLESPLFVEADLNAIVDSASYALESIINENGAVISRDELPAIRGDPPKLFLLYKELLCNALKFRAEAPPRIHCSVYHQDPSVVFSVMDNGSGIAEKQREQVFKPLKRLHGRDREGTGMGLAISRRIVEIHGGKIWVQANPAGGADFRFTLAST